MLMVTYVSIKDDKEDVTYIFDEYGILTSIKRKRDLNHVSTMMNMDLLQILIWEQTSNV